MPVFPQTEGGPFRNTGKVVVGREHDEVVADAKLREQAVDGSDLDAAASARVSQCRRFDVIGAGRSDEWKGGKTLDDGCRVSWPAEPLQQLLKDQSGREDRFSSRQGLSKTGDGGVIGRSVPSQGEGPYARVDEQVHVRERSRL